MSSNRLGRYEIVREIGRSNDIVYEATDTGIGRRVALKELLLPPNLDGAQRRERVERFYREARAAGGLTHPNIVTIYEAGEDQGRHYIAMEFLEGQTLRDVIEVEGKLQVDRAVEYAKQICDALSYAHSRGIIHRDIKPDNIQILPGGRIVKITDFGIARIMEEPTLTSSGQVFGTPSYMSPEQVAGKPLAPNSDLFSLGVVLFEMLVGRKPFAGDSVVSITYSIMNQEVTVPPTVPPFLDQVIRHSLQKDPRYRYQSASEMATDLDSPVVMQPIYQATSPDPYGAPSPTPTYQPTGAPSPYPSTPFPRPQQAPPPIPPPLPVDLPPRLPKAPLISENARYFMKVMIVVLIVCAFVVGGIVMFNMSYRGYLDSENVQTANRHMQSGNAYYKQESYQAAIQEFRKAFESSENTGVRSIAKRNITSCYVSLGNKSLAAGNIEGAGQWWTEAYRNEPSSPTALSAMATYFLQKGINAESAGDMQSAIDFWRQAQSLAPGSEAGINAGERLQRAMNLESVK